MRSHTGMESWELVLTECRSLLQRDRSFVVLKPGHVHILHMKSRENDALLQGGLAPWWIKLVNYRICS